jgi:hypothetical protein
MTTCRVILPPGSPLLLGAPMVFLHVGVRHRAAVGAGVDQQNLVVPAAAAQARVLEASSRLVGTKLWPPASAGGTHGVEGLLKTAARR